MSKATETIVHTVPAAEVARLKAAVPEADMLTLVAYHYGRTIAKAEFLTFDKYPNATYISINSDQLTMTWMKVWTTVTGDYVVFDGESVPVGGKNPIDYINSTAVQDAMAFALGYSRELQSMYLDLNSQSMMTQSIAETFKIVNRLNSADSIKQ